MSIHLKTHPKIQFTHRLEVQFLGIPHPAVRAGLKNHGFTWDGRAGVWHLSRPINSATSPDGRYIPIDGWATAIGYLQSHHGLTSEGAAELTKARNERRESDSIRGMLIANGIE